MTEVEGYVHADDARLWTAVSGNGIPLLLFNGGPGCDDYLGPVASMLHDVARVVRFEPRGCGRSDWDGRYELDTLLSDAETIREWYGVDRWIVGGHSAGTNLALAYALRHPNRSLGVLGMAGGKIFDDREWSAIYHQRRESIGEDLGGKIFHADPEVNRHGNEDWRAFCRRPTFLRELADLTLPCVFINASEDIRPNWPTQQLAELLPAARYVEISGAAHTIWLTHAEALEGCLHEALRYIVSFGTDTSD
jgi:proline iminopeptidase